MPTPEQLINIAKNVMTDVDEITGVETRTIDGMEIRFITFFIDKKEGMIAEGTLLAATAR